MPTLAERPSSSLDTYFHEVNETALLDAESERRLGHRIEEGDCEARDLLVRANLRLVVRIAKDFLGRGLGLEDLIQEGSLGLVRAAEGYNPSYGTRFSTYAGHWIRQAMTRALENQGQTIRVPGYAVDLVSRWRQAVGKFVEETRRLPSDIDVARYLHITSKQLKIIKRALAIYNQASSPSHSRNARNDIKMVADELLPSDPQLDRDEQIEQVLKLIDALEDREAIVLRLRFGLGGSEPLTLSSIGEQLQITRERVRQIEREALVKLRERLEAIAS